MSLFASDSFCRKVLKSNQIHLWPMNNQQYVLYQKLGSVVNRRYYPRQEKIKDFSAEKGSLTFSAMWYGALSLHSHPHTAARRRRPHRAHCGYLAWLSNNSAKTNELSSCRWKLLKPMLWSWSHCHESTLPERHSIIKVWETVESEQWKVKAESFKPAQECQHATRSISSFPPDLSSSWIREQVCMKQSKIILLCFTLHDLPSSSGPAPQSWAFKTNSCFDSFPWRLYPALSLMPRWVLALEGKQQGYSYLLGDLIWWFYAEKSLKVGVRNLFLSEEKVRVSAAFKFTHT